MSNPSSQPSPATTDGVSPDALLAALEADEHVGFCRHCGAEHDAVEPDVHNYPCGDCGRNMVAGAEWLAERIV